MTFRLQPAAFLALFFLAIFSVAAAAGWEWPYIAKLMPVYIVAVPGIVLCLVQLYRDLTRWDEQKRSSQQRMEMDEAFVANLDPATEIRRTAAFFGWFAGGAVAIWLLGIVIALPLLMLLYTAVEGKEKWLVSVLLSAGVFLFLWGFFEYALEMRWPPGMLFRWR
jgi:hypothetical protein